MKALKEIVYFTSSAWNKLLLQSSEAMKILWDLLVPIPQKIHLSSSRFALSRKEIAFNKQTVVTSDIDIWQAIYYLYCVKFRELCDTPASGESQDKEHC